MKKKTDEIEILDAKENASKKSTSTSGALVPYRASVPALLPTAVGNLDAYIRAANLAPILSAEEEHSLAVRLRDENDLAAAQQLIVSHLRLVVSVARSYLGYGLPHADLIQEGNIGLMKAIRHFDPDHGVRLMTFAVHWMRSEIQDYILRNWRLVKVVSTKNQKKLFFNLRQLKSDTKALNQEKAREIAQTLNVKPEEVLEMDVRMSGSDTSLEAPGDEEEDRNTYAPIDYLEDEGNSPLERIESKARESLVNNGLQVALKTLDPRARRIIQARWLTESDDGEATPKTLQELAKELGISTERVRQIEKKAISQMRSVLTKE